MRVFALSDVHVDFADNRAWMRELSARDTLDDALILAGDVSHDADELLRSLVELRERFAHVFFVPGNHDLWIRDGEEPDSLAKLDRLLARLSAHEITTGPKRIGSGTHTVWVVPLLSWYVRPEEGPDSLFLPGGDSDSSEGWADDFYVRWPAFEQGFSPARQLLDRNESILAEQHDAPVISASHFVPRSDLLPALGATGEPGASGSFNFSRVAGSRRLDEQIRRLGSRVHVHGHQHRNRHRTIDGRLYVSHALGYPRERERGEILHLGRGPKLIWEAGFPAAPPLAGEY